MKDNVSIIFAAIIGTLLIVILPLYSILDRQDSMSYNVVLTQTTNLVDSIRNNGFIDKKTYMEYVSALASTSNTYKVSIEAYKKTLIPEIDENGNKIPDSFVEEVELYNTRDILEMLEGEQELSTSDKQNSNIRDNVYLFNKNDEVYIKVKNTNVTAGSIIYKFIAGVSNDEIINISYGGIVNNVNWELYDKIQEGSKLLPEITMEVPVNGKNETNIINLKSKNVTNNIDPEQTEVVIVDKNNEQVDIENISGSSEDYTYLYDLNDDKNKTIKFAVELHRIDKINVSDTAGGELAWKSAKELYNMQQAGNTGIGEAKNNIMKYIQLNGMYADVAIQFRKEGSYYAFDIILTNVRMSSLEYISNNASVTILPGLGKDSDGNLSLGTESIQIELLDEGAINSVTISNPIIWKKFLKEKEPKNATTNSVYVNEEIAFLISYSGINQTSEGAKEIISEAILKNIVIQPNTINNSDIQIITAAELLEKYNITTFNTDYSGHIMIKFKYNSPNDSINYVRLEDDWIELEATEGDDGTIKLAEGAKSGEYTVSLDNVPPLKPQIVIDGTLGDNNWYVSDVRASLLQSTVDEVKASYYDVESNELKEGIIAGGSGVDRNTMIITGAVQAPETVMEDNNYKTINADGISHVVAKAYDYSENFSQTEPTDVKIDKTTPTAPVIKVTGTQGDNGWYKSDVDIQIQPGSDATSGVNRTTYKIVGAANIEEKIGTSYILTDQGKSTIIATTYDNAGNKAEAVLEINLDKETPAEAKIEVISGVRNSDTSYYKTDVTLRVTIDAGNAVSGLGTSEYKITGTSEMPTVEFTEKQKDIIINQNGIYRIIVSTKTLAGNVKRTEYEVKIDKSAPNAPTVNLEGTKGTNDWFTSNIKMTVTSNGDVGSSGIRIITYMLDDFAVEKQVVEGEEIVLGREGEYNLDIYARDNAGNVSKLTKKIKVDKTKPESGRIKIDGTKGQNDWYTSDVNISYENESDSISGISRVELSKDNITESTNGTEVIMKIIDNAGNTSTISDTIKVDKEKPTNPTINLITEGIEEGTVGVVRFNKNVKFSITPGVDSIEDINNVWKTTYMITTNSGQTILVPETIGTEYEITQTGIMTITAKTYDNAGNVSEDSRVIWINKEKPVAPQIISINDDTSHTVEGTNNEFSIKLDNIDQSNTIYVQLLSNDEHEEKYFNDITGAQPIVTINITKPKGKYKITIKQINMFGTESDPNPGLYYYNYI